MDCVAGCVGFLDDAFCSHDFYQRFGWERWKGSLPVRAGAETIRTLDEDGGVTVQRLGPDAAVDRAAAIARERRSGDDW